MKINVLENGVVVVRNMTPEELAEYENRKDNRTYQQRVVDRIRQIYSIDDEIAIIRQRDTKPEEFSAYNQLVEKIKTEEKRL